jgi:iron complex outermembrane receptor protein
MTMPVERKALGGLLAGLLIPLLFATAAVAQATTDQPKEPAAAEDKSTSVTLEPVEVTAQRRVEKLQDVPVAVTAFTHDQIESRGIDSIDDLDGLAPGLQISKTPSNTTISQITIRGSSQINPAIYWDPAVGLYLDGVYIGKSQGSIFDIVDLTRVEVLRGPQGTLYGRNTIGGTLNLWTRPPSGVFSGTGSLEIGNYNALVGRASVDLPQMGIASVSIGGRVARRDGWVEATPGSSVSELNDVHNDAARVAARFEFSEKLEGNYHFDYSNVDQINNFDQLYRLERTGAFDPNAPAAGLYDLVAPFASREREETATVDSPSFERSEVMGHAFTLSWNLDGRNTIKSITGYRSLEWDDSLDLDGSPLPVAFTQRFTSYDQFSQDFQYIGRTDRWNYVGGLYYFTDDGDTNNPQHFFGGAADFDSRYGTKTSAWAAYGQVDYKVLDPLTVALGLRYTRENKELDRVFGVRGSPDDPFFYLIPEGTHAEKTFDATTPMVSAKYQFNKDLNVYARYAEGFKSGGFNGEFSQAPSGDPDEDIPALIQKNIDETRTPFKPESQKSVEVGVKTTFLKGRGQLNVAVFQNKLEDLQASIFLGQGAAATVVRNAGEATVRGFEVESAFVLIPGTTLRGNYAYLDAEYDKFVDGGINQANNRAFVHAPENMFNVVLDSEFLRRSWGALRGTVDYVYTDDFYTYPYQLTPPPGPLTAQVAGDSEVKAHGILNLRLALSGIPVGQAIRGEVALWCRNATDDDTATNFIDFGPGFGSLTAANFQEPRTFGITGIVRW